MTVPTPDSERTTDSGAERILEAVPEAKPVARRGRYAGVSDEERAEIELAIAGLWREYKASGEEGCASA